MLRRLGLIGVGAVAFALSCGGHSEVFERAAAGGGKAGHGGTGAGARSAGGCAACGGRAGAAGGAGRRANASGGASGAAEAGAAAVGEVSGGAPSESGGAGQAGEASSAGGVTDGAAGGGATAGTGETNAGAAGDAPTGSGNTLSITKVAVYQATEVTLVRGGALVQPNAPIVAGRDALVRVWVAPGTAWAPRTVAAELDVTAGTSSRSATDSVEVSAASTDDELGSTFTFTLRAGEVRDTATLSLTLHDTNGGAVLDRFPTTDAFTLGASSSHGDFLVTLVPLIAGGLTPDLGAETVARFQRYLSRVYPASGVQMTVRAAVTLAADVEPDGTGWDDALDVLYSTRDADDPAPNVYYFGVLTPAPTFSAYCTGNCVVGLSTVATKNDVSSRGAIGTGYFVTDADTFSQETMAHELGHALGREHAPCGDPDDVDPDYPYSYGEIGVLGFNGKSLLDKDEYKDEMSYCVPVWISDYTWGGIFDRISYVNGLSPRVVSGAPAARERYRTLAVERDGSLRWGRERSPSSAPAGEPLAVELLDRNGGVLDVVAASFARFDHLPGGFVSVPAAALERPDVASVRVNGAVLAVP
ncbi:MAG TPA: hypothetical protein VMI54_28900 [Polyangiaceae bacterium]|nr:hypothetical protein [Polyangiaceae bacterium]